MTQRIAIVGGGFLGAQLAKALQDHADVTLIEQNSHFVNAPAMVRALVQPRLLDQALVPYDRLLARGQVVRARAVQVDATGVTLADGRHIQADYTVLATGSGNGPAFKPGEDGIDGLRAANARIHAQLLAAQRVVIVGAGAVGTELAGELMHHLPGKQVTLVSADATLFPTMPPALGASLLRQLQAAGVQVVLGAKADTLRSLTEPYAGTLRLSNGQELVADLIVPAIGSRANTALLAGLPGAVNGSAGRIRGDAWMRPSRLPNVFAAGDAVDLGDPMTVVAQMRQLPWLRDTLRALLQGKPLDRCKPYRAAQPGKSPLLVPLGPYGGASFLVVTTVGPMLTRLLKGKDLFVTKYRKLFGAA